jgi:glyoxylase-like metal-dependent hydrolase (beta-lactamase superfamily II)
MNIVNVGYDSTNYYVLADSRVFLAQIGISGQIIHTPGHCDDSVTLVLNEGIAFTGDLSRPEMSEGMALASWQQIRALGIQRIYPGHGSVWSLTAPQQK